MLFTYEELQNYISLNAEDENTDRMLLTSSYNTLKKILNFELEERNYTELHTVTDYKIITEQINIIEIISIVDMNTKEKIEHAVVDEMTNTILFINPRLERHVVFVNYKAGYIKETFPEEFKEALIRIFLYKKNQLNKSINIEETESEKLPDDIKQNLEKYKRKRF